METRSHPTHHDRYRPQRTFGGVVAGVAGAFTCVFVAMVDSGDSAVLHRLKVTVLGAGALAFVGGTLLALATEIPHQFAACASCGRLLWRSRIDYRQSYYRCRRCAITWTCPCHKAAR